MKTRPVLVLAVAAFALAGCAPRARRSPVKAVDPATVRVHVPSPTSKTKAPGCQGTCQVDAPEHLSDGAVDTFLSKVAAMPPGTDSLELDTLLFHDRDTLARLDARAVELPPDWEAFLRRELARRRVLVTIRVVDDSGAERARIEHTWDTGVRAHHVVEDVTGVPPFEASGTVVRVGREHLWVRM